MFACIADISSPLYRDWDALVHPSRRMNANESLSSLKERVFGSIDLTRGLSALLQYYENNTTTDP
jgi:hypothetical protein